MSVSRSGTIVVWGKWDAQSPTLPLNSYLSQSNACGIITVMDYNHSQLSCHAICTVLFSCMWLCHLQSNCHTQTFSTFLSVIHDQMARWPLHSLPLVLYTSANLKSRVSFLLIYLPDFSVFDFFWPSVLYCLAFLLTRSPCGASIRFSYFEPLRTFGTLSVALF